MIDPFRARMYRLILGFAAAYNIGFGLWTALWPRSFFDVFEMAPPRYPSIWACLGMVVGLYGAVYALAAARLRVAKPLVAIGLAGKVLGPAGWLLAVRSGEWPVRTFTLITFNDLIWWVPFALLLVEGTRAGERLHVAVVQRPGDPLDTRAALSCRGSAIPVRSTESTVYAPNASNTRFDASSVSKR